MRRYAKASTAGSTQRQAGRLGRFFRLAGATRGTSHASKGSGAPKAKRLVLPLTVFAAILALMVIAIPASATKTHVFKENFGSVGEPEFTEPEALAVDQSTGDVLVMDVKAKTISRFNPDGTPADFSALSTNVIDGKGAGDATPQNGLNFSGFRESQIAIDSSGTATDGDIYVTQKSPPLINVFSKQGNYLGQLTAAGVTSFTKACGVAVDSSGAVYVGDHTGGIHKFVPAANPPVNADNTANFSTLSQPCALAAGAGPTAGFIFATEYEGPVSKLDSSSGEVKYAVSPGVNALVAVDPGTGHVLAGAFFGGDIAINEFDASGAASATSVSSLTFPNAISNEIVQGVAVRGSTGDLYLTKQNIPYLEVYGPTAAVPDVVTAAATAVTKDSATLNGTVNPDGAALTECLFEIGPPKEAHTETIQKYTETAPCVPDAAGVGSGTSPVAVHADVNLHPGTVYHYRLKAANANDSSVGKDMSAQALGPAIDATWSEDVIRKEATLKAAIDPEGTATTYHFEWGTSSAYGNESPESAAGSDSSSHEVSAFLEGLAPARTYHYRVVATSAVAVNEGPDRTFRTYAPFVAKTDCPNQTFRTGFSAPLPDCRAFEMVSPLDKNGGDIKTEGGGLQSNSTALNQVAVNGESFTYSSYKPFAGQASGVYANQYLAHRGAEGWSTEGINAPQGTTIFDPLFDFFNEFENSFYVFSEDLSSAWLRDYNKTPLTPDGQPNYVNFYRRDNSTGSYEALTVNPPLSPTDKTLLPNEFGTAEIQGVSRDGSHAVYMARAQLTPDAPPGTERQLYDFSNGELELVSVLPDGSANLVGVNLGREGYLGDRRRINTVSHAISDDGSRIFWTVTGAGNSPAAGPIYVRIDGERTVQVSADPRAEFWTASADGSKALFSANGTANLLPNLYEFDVDAETRSLVAKRVKGVLGASEDLSYIYFVSPEVLAAGATAEEDNLYLDHEGTTTFIATVSRQDAKAADTPTAELPTATTIIEARPFYRSSRVTPDGRHIAFTSHRSLTGYDNSDANNGEADKEVFLYDADADRLTCASCNPSGARPVGQPAQRPFEQRETLVGDVKREWTAAWMTTSLTANFAPRALSDNGNRLFFNSFDALVPQDNNGMQDVYQWEAQGSGTCQEADGCISLISSGQSPKRSEFVDATPNGNDVFFETESSLDPHDPGLIDIYDARAGGGFTAALTPTIPCVGDACQSSPPAPNDPTPASAGFHGAGNPQAKKPRARCSARHRKNTAKSKRHAKRQQAKRCKRANGRAGR